MGVASNALYQVALTLLDALTLRADVGPLEAPTPDRLLRLLYKPLADDPEGTLVHIEERGPDIERAALQRFADMITGRQEPPHA